MKYFLHDSNAFNDEKITELFINFGYEGLGLFYTFLEKIASQEKPIKTSVLKSQLKVGKKLEKCWNFMESLDIVSTNNGESFNKQLLNFSETFKIKSEKNKKRISEWRERQDVIKNVTCSESVRNTPKVKVSKVKVSKEKEIKPIADKSAFKKCCNVYNDFCLQQTSCSGIFDGLQGKSLKSIIDYLSKNVEEQPATDESIVNAFKVILDNFDKWDKFHQGQLKLNQISSNLINIINSIRNGKQKSSNNQLDESIRNLQSAGII